MTATRWRTKAHATARGPNAISLRLLVSGRDTRAGRIFELAVQGLILLSLVSFSLETLPRLPPTLTQILRVLEIVTVALFTVEYLLRLAYAEHRIRHTVSFFALVDLASILPFYLALGIDLRALRILRLLRIFRALKLLRYTRAIEHFKRSFQMIRGELVVFCTAAGLFIYLSSVAIYYFEREAQPDAFASVFHAMWWSIVTLTTVGYGDIYPITVGGRMFTALMLLIGLGVVAVPTGLMASALSKTVIKPPATRPPSVP